MRPGAGHARAFVLAFALVAAACQRPELGIDAGAALPPAPAPERSICERPVRNTAPAEPTEIEASFHAFAKDWLEMKQERSSPGTRREIGDFEVELSATGNARAPYVGTLRYCELELRCPDAVPASCTPAKRNAITEIFRFEAGKWQY